MDDTVTTIVGDKKFVVAEFVLEKYPLIKILFKRHPVLRGKTDKRSDSEDQEILKLHGSVIQNCLNYLSSGIIEQPDDDEDYQRINSFFDYYDTPFRVFLIDYPFDIIREHLYALWKVYNNKSDNNNSDLITMDSEYLSDVLESCIDFDKSRIVYRPVQATRSRSIKKNLEERVNKIENLIKEAKERRTLSINKFFWRI